MNITRKQNSNKNLLASPLSYSELIIERRASSVNEKSWHEEWIINYNCLSCPGFFFSNLGEKFRGCKSAIRRVASITDGSSMAPFPISPHANFFAIGEIRVIPRSWAETRWRLVKGLSHINVFIAGAMNKGFWKSHARTTQVSRLSQRPPATCEGQNTKPCKLNLSHSLCPIISTSWNGKRRS